MVPSGLIWFDGFPVLPGCYPVIAPGPPVLWNISDQVFPLERDLLTPRPWQLVPTALLPPEPKLLLHISTCPSKMTRVTVLHSHISVTWVFLMYFMAKREGVLNETVNKMLSVANPKSNPV